MDTAVFDGGRPPAHASSSCLTVTAPSIPVLLTCLAVWSVTLGLTLKIRDFARARGLLDRPNERSSHREPTPRGGGLAFVVTISAGLFATLLGDWLPTLWAIALLIAGGGIAAVGWVDDHGHVAAPVRLLVHIMAACALTLLIGPLSLTSAGLDNRWLEWIVSILLVAWIVNLVNFMDGIDAIAASETSFVAFGFAICSAAAAAAALVHPSATLALLIGAGSLGFLIPNWPPASIFMGDVGSGFLGIMLGGLVLVAHQMSWTAVIALLILLAAFMADASITLMRRALHGQAFWTAHRSHAYQHLARRWGSHLRVTLSVLALNLLYLMPLALAVMTGWVHPALGLVLAYVPVSALALAAGAGSTKT